MKTIKPVPMITMKTMSLFIFASLFLFANCEKTEVDLKERFIGEWCEYIQHTGTHTLMIYTFNTNDTLYYSKENDTTYSYKIPYNIISITSLEVKMSLEDEITRHDYYFHSEDTLEIKQFRRVAIMPEYEDVFLVKKKSK